MRTKDAYIVACLLLSATITTSCGRVGTGPRVAAESAAESAGKWAAGWSNDVKGEAKLPPRLNIPSPPKITLEGAATGIQDDTRKAAEPLAALRAQMKNENINTAAEFTKDMACQWFAWYVKDKSHTVPDSSTFLNFLTHALLGVSLETPISKQVMDSAREAAELFRDAISRAKNETEEQRNIAIAGVCSMPTP